MTSRQESKLKMYLVVKEKLSTNSALVSTLPNYSVYLGNFNGGIEQIGILDTLLTYDKSGITVNKDKLKLNLATLGSDTTRKIKAYARFAQNDVLLSQTDYNDSDLKSAADTSLVNIVQGIYDLAQLNLEALAAYSITAATQTALLKALTDFKAALPKPRVETTEYTKVSTQLANAFKTTDKALEDIKVLIDTLKVSQPVFWKEFRASCKIIDAGAGSLALTGLISEQGTGEGIKGATITFVPDIKTADGNKSDHIVKKSSKKGGFRIKEMLPGAYTVTVKKNGYADHTESIVVVDGELTRLNIELVKK